IVWRRLDVPLHFSGIDVERHERAGEQVRAPADVPCTHRMWIPGAPISEVERGVVDPLDPRHAAAGGHDLRVGPGLRTRFAGLGYRVPAPHELPVIQVAGF